MRFRINKNKLTRNLRDALRKCSYFSIQDRMTGQNSYLRRLSQSQHYPRFHLYIDEQGDELQFNLHLDQKKESYRGAKAHSADYNDSIVEAEFERIKSLIY